MSPTLIVGKSSTGKVGRRKFERPALIMAWPSATAISTSAPSGSLRTMSYSRCADTVVVPAVPTAHSTCVAISMSMSVAVIRARVGGLEHDIGQDRNGVAAFDHGLDLAE